MEHRENFTKFIMAICEMFDREMSQFLVRIYWEALKPFTDSECEIAFNEILVSSRFFPKPIDIIEAIRGSSDVNAAKAWIKVENTVKRIGTYDSVKFDDPVIHSCIEAMGGWISLGQVPENELKWKQKEFERLYTIMAGKGGPHPEYLVGKIELENSARGFRNHVPKPVLIKDNGGGVQLIEAVQ